MADVAYPDHESASKMTDYQPPAAEASADAGAWKVDSVSIRPAENGGFIVSCSKSRPNSGGEMGGPTVNLIAGPMWQSKDYAFSGLPEVMTYLQQEFDGGASPVADAKQPV